MTEPNATSNQPTDSPAPDGSRKSSMMKYIIIGAMSVVLVVLVAGATVMLLGRQEASISSEAAGEGETTVTGQSTQTRQLTDDEILDSLLAAGGEDPSVADLIEETLAGLDFDMDSLEMESGSTKETGGASSRSSEWLKQEEDRLSKWEAQLTARQKELTRIEDELNRKMLVIEQAESARIASLARLYDGMDSRAVAKLMSSLDDETVVSILPRMKAKNASQVLQLLPAARAAKLSKQMITIAEN